MAFVLTSLVKAFTRSAARSADSVALLSRAHSVRAATGIIGRACRPSALGAHVGACSCARPLSATAR